MIESVIKYEYKPIYKPNQVICGTGQTAIVTGWRPIKQVASLLEPHEYAVIGNLYSATRGINFLIRNLLANPHVYYLLAIGDTRQDLNSGSVQCLIDFFVNGFTAGYSDTGKECWAINSEIKGYIDKEIPSDALLCLMSKIKIPQYRPLCFTEAISFAKVPDFTPLIDADIAQIFPYEEPQSAVLPGHRYAHRIEGKTIAETWVKIIHRIKTTGTIRPTGYDGQWQELIDLVAVVTDEPEDFYFPEPNYLPCNREFLKEYIPQVCEDSPYQEGVKYTYGQRIRSWFGKDQVEQVINKLVGEIDAASAVISLWDVNDHDKGGSPCLNHIWVRVVDNELSLTATFRSNDMFAAWPSNAMGLRALQKHIRDEIVKRSDYNLKLGPLITISQSAHIYSDCWENADRLISQQYKQICKQEDYSDPVGNFLIEWDKSEIKVTQTTPGSGEPVACFNGKNPLKLVREICDSSPGIQSKHAAYLGVEIFKCYQSKEDYKQDK